MRVMVTGGAGFIGSHLIERLLASGIEVDVVDDLSSGSLSNLATARSMRGGKLHFHQIDVKDAGVATLVERRKPEIVFHLAARSDVRMSMVDPMGDADVNILGSLRILDASRRFGVQKVIFAASAGVYGFVPEDSMPIVEDVAHRPESNYGISKDTVLKYLEVYRSNYDLEYTALILANVYGPRQGARGEAGVVSVFARSLLEGRPTTIFGDGTQTRDFIYVDDVVDAFWRAMDAGDGTQLNIGTGDEISINDLYHKLTVVTGREGTLPIYAQGVTGEIKRSVLNARRAGWYLRWHPFTKLGDGLRSVVSWMEAEASAE